MTIKPMTLKGRFYLVTVLMLLILTGFCVYMIFTVSRMAAITETISDHPMVVSNDAFYANAEVLRMHRDLMEILLVEEDYEVNILADRIRISEGNVYAALDTIAYGILGEEGKQLQVQTRDLFDQWKNIRQDIISAARVGDLDKAVAINENQGVPHVEQLEQKFAELNSYARNKANGFQDDSDALEKRTATLIITSVTLAFLLIVSALVWMTWSVLTDIKHLNVSLKGIIASGEFKSVALEGSEEFVALSNIFNDLISTLSSQLWVKKGNQLLNMAFLNNKSFKRNLKDYVDLFSDYGDFLSVAYYGLDGGVLKLESVVNRMGFMRDEYLTGQYHVGECVKTNERKLIHYSDMTPYDSHDLPFQSVMFLPVSMKDEAYGVLTIVFKNMADEVTMEFIEECAQDLSSFVATAIQRRKINDLLEDSIKANEELTTRQAELEENQAELEIANNSLQEQRDLLNAKSNELSKQNNELVLLREELVKKYRDLEEVTKYRSQFLANVSHELRTPLNSILVLSNMLKEKKLGDYGEKDTEKVQVINKAANELLLTINDILDLAKIENGKVELTEDLFNPAHLVSEIKAIYEPMMTEKGLISIFKTNYEKPIYGDRSKISHIITNFLSNAIKFTASGEISVVFGTNNNTDYPLRIDVTDTGIGIEEDKLEAIFDEFVQSDGSINRTYGGTGLGLSICRNYASLINGRIKVTSQEGNGSTFTLLLPASTVTMAVDTDDPSTEDSEVLQQEPFTSRHQLDSKHLDKKILVCDDEPMNVFSLSSILENIGVVPVAALSSNEAITVCESNSIDMILMDFMMPEIDGVETLDRMKSMADLDRIPVVIITAANLDPKDVESIYGKGYRLLKKPINYNDIVNLLNELL